jgi:hypothetical protein
LRHTGADVDLRRPRRMMIALRNREMKLVMMKESKVCEAVSISFCIRLDMAYASTCDSSICLHGIRNDRAVGWNVEHRELRYRESTCSGVPRLECR